MNALDFSKKKSLQEKISMVTCYDYWSAKIIDETNIDCLLVGDTATMIMHGYNSTIPASIEIMTYHTAAVARGTEKFIIGDMPFLSYRKDLRSNMLAVEKLMQAGANAIKLEGCCGNQSLIEHIVQSGIPVVGHIGLTPQSTNSIGGFKVQGKEQTSQQKIINEAKELEQLGCCAIVLECIPESLAQQITSSLAIATIGIGAGRYVDGQVLVLHDLLGLYTDISPKFVKQFMSGKSLIKQALTDYHCEVQCGDFPCKEHSY